MMDEKQGIHEGDVTNGGFQPNPAEFTQMRSGNIRYDLPGCLSKEQLEQFYNEGFCVVKDYFTLDELQPCRDATAELVEELAQKLYKAGKIKSLYREYGLFQRLTALENAFPGANILMFKTGKIPEAYQKLWSCDKFLNMAEQVLGPDVAGHPVWNLRVKTPKNDATTVPWHQDSAYFAADSLDHMVLTAWVPFLDTNFNNGGMQMIRRSHRSGKVARHTCCQLGFWYVMLDEEDMEKDLDIDPKESIVTCDVPYGGFLLFNNLTVHRSVVNHSNDVRWSVDLRWQSPHKHWGFYNIAEGIKFRENGKNVEPDWPKFLSVNRKEAWQRLYNKKELETSDEFDLTVTGPWIGRWEIVNHNVHTEAFLKA